MKPDQLYSIFLQSEGICTDSRTAKKGQLFFALKGYNFDGNKYAATALENGCSFAVIDDPRLISDKRFFLVENCLSSLQKLANMHRKSFNCPVLAITGSNGKTTTKELCTAIIRQKFPNVLSTKGNLNNHIGVPLSLLSCKNPDFAIIEMGANHPGEIDLLCNIAEPDFGLITNIGKAHLAGFGSLDGVIKTKTELYRYLAVKKGIVFLNGLNKILLKESKLHGLQNIYYGDGPDVICDGFVSEADEFLKLGIHFINSEKWKVSTQLTGRYNFENIIAAACIGKHFNVQEEKIISAIENYKVDNSRSQIKKTKKNTLVSDAYNANPTSMKEAILNFNQLKSKNKILILGDMLELGTYSKEEHKYILEFIHSLNFKNVFLTGNEFYSFKKDYNYTFFKNIFELIEHFSNTQVKDQLILLKASRGIRLEKLIKVL